ncbi:hypothetical protein [Absidia glauca]|uniref:RZ-type domain-containing protein n=1 Tax=Absidia glauca TaxID=4829 RepID=A0A163IWC8_ABSGL|nr:hypothetical protein [Absidia glauca]
MSIHFQNHKQGQPDVLIFVLFCFPGRSNDMAKRQVLDKFGCTFDDYHSLLRQCHRQRQERGDNPAFKSENMQFPPPLSPSSPQQQQPHQQQQKRRPMSHTLGNNECIPYEYIEQSSSALASLPPLNEAWSDSRRRQFSKSSESNIQQEPIPAFDSRTANSSSHLQRYVLKLVDSWSQPQPRTKISATNTWSETSNTLSTTTWVDSYHTSESSTSSIVDPSATQHNNNYNTNDIAESNRNRVKPVKPERFEDLQLEAMNHWTNGIDLNLEKTQQKKGKKSGWLTMEEFATFNAAPRQDQAMKATHMTTSTSHERKTPSSSSSTSSSSTSPSSTPRQPTINTTSTPPPLPRFTTFKTTATTPSTNLNVANNSKMESGPVLAKLVANLPKGNHGVYQFLDAIQQQHDGFGERSLPAFIKALPLILSNLPNESNRTFKKFVSTLLIVLGDTISPLRPRRLSDKQSVSKALEDFKLSIIEAATRYIESYVVVASDFSLLLDFMVCFTRELPTTFAAATVPPILHALQEHYNQLRDLLLPRPCKEIYQHLMQLQLWVSANLVETPAAANPPARSNHASTVPPTTSLPSPAEKEERIIEKEQVQQQHSQPVSETHTTPVKTFLQQQLKKYQDYLKFVKSTATKLAASSSPTKDDDEWAIIRNARQCPPMLLAPVIPDTITVYRCDDQLGQGLLHASLIGCVAIVISDDKRSTSPDSIMVGTTIQYASSDTNDDERTQPFAIALNQKEHLDHGGTYTLILTSIQATPLLPLMDWLQHTCANLNENDFARDLISCLFSVSPDASTTDFVPDYLQNFALDISTLMTPQYRGCKAKVSENSWPQLQPKHLRLPPDRRPLLYVISESQVASLQYALSHRFAVVRGGPGTGKTFLAGKLLELSYQVLKQRHIHQPILVMAASASTLLTLLSSVAQPPLAQDMVIFGNDDEGGTGAGDIGDRNRLLSARGAMKLSTLSKGSAAWKQHRHESRELEQCHGKLIVLQEHRQSVVVDQDPKYIVDLMPPSYRNALFELCPQNDDATTPNAKTIGKLWIQQEEDEEHATSLPVQTYTRLLNNIANQVTTMQPITKRDDFLQQQQWMDTHRPFLAPLSEGRSWPFVLNLGEYDSYLKTAGDQVRYALFNIWTLVDASDLWELPVAARRQMYTNVVDTYREHVDKMIKYLLAQQDRLLASLHRLRTAQWQSTCTFNRVVAMTTGFAMANQAFVRALSPHVVIVDDAHTVSGGFLAATGAMSGVEHLVLLGGEQGDSQDQNRFLVPSRHAHELVDQWRMAPDIFRLWQAALDQKATSSTTIPAMKKPDPSEAVQGMKHRTSLMVFDSEDNTTITNQVCQFIGHLALYLYQQNDKAADIAILTINHGDRELLQLVVAQLANTTLFSAGLVGSVKVECVDAFKGKECDLALLFINSPFSVDQMSVALSRARKGLVLTAHAVRNVTRSAIENRVKNPVRRLWTARKHPCRSTCGEPCSICPICDPDTQCPITLRPFSEFDDDEKIYTLPDCGCSFSLEGLDSYFESQVNFGEHMAIKQRVCPSCLKPVYTAIRFGKQIKSQLNLIDAVKEQQERILQQLTDEEKYNIINAMNEESMTSINNIVGGRWFVCKNQHPYFIGDCGGATEVSVCPQCNEAIGGLQHQVINTNRFYGEFDGSAEPAWPGQPRS